MEKNKKLILILLIAFAVVITLSFFLVKLKDLGYLGKKEAAKISIQPISQEAKDFSGTIMSINKDKKSISIKGTDLIQKKQIDLTFLVNDSTEITLSGSQEKISFDDLLVIDPIGINAVKNQDGSWTAKKIQVTETNIVGGRIINVEKNRIAISKDLGELGPSMTFGVLIDSKTKIIIKDYTNAIQVENKSFDATKVVEKDGTINDLPKDSFVVVYAKEGNIPRKTGDFVASKIEIILNNK